MRESRQPGEPAPGSWVEEAMRLFPNSRNMTAEESAEMQKIHDSLNSPHTAPADPNADLLAALEQLAAKAKDVVQSMSGDKARWRMTLPVDRERDYDVIIWDLATAATRAAEALRAGAKDSERLDWLEQNQYDLIAPMAIPEFGEKPTRWMVIGGQPRDDARLGEAATLRAAIDAAREADGGAADDR